MAELSIWEVSLYRQWVPSWLPCLYVCHSSYWTVLLPHVTFLLFWCWGQNLHLMLGKHYTTELQPFLVYKLSLQMQNLTGCFETLFKTLVFMLCICECLHICARVSDGYRSEECQILGTALETVVSHHVGTGIQNCVLSKSS